MVAPIQTRPVLRFGAFEVDLSSGELRHGGVKLKVQEQPFRVLAALLEQPGEVVTREQLRARLWSSDTFVDFEHSLNASIKKLRQALRDDAACPHFIETLPKRGVTGSLRPLKLIAESPMLRNKPQRPTWRTRPLSSDRSAAPPS